MQKKSAVDVKVLGQDPAEGSREVVEHELERQGNERPSDLKRPSDCPKPVDAPKFNVKVDPEH
jgi:hypothetical protein